MRSIDLRGLRCPLPALKTRRALLDLAAGREIEVLCDDPLAGVDIPNVVREAGDAVLLSENRGKEIRFVVRRAGER